MSFSSVCLGSGGSSGTRLANSIRRPPRRLSARDKWPRRVKFNSMAHCVVCFSAASQFNGQQRASRVLSWTKFFERGEGKMRLRGGLWPSSWEYGRNRCAIFGLFVSPALQVQLSGGNSFNLFFHGRGGKEKNKQAAKVVSSSLSCRLIKTRASSLLSTAPQSHKRASPPLHLLSDKRANFLPHVHSTAHKSSLQARQFTFPIANSD